jgi:DNA-binding transcriptional MerR regulator
VRSKKTQIGPPQDQPAAEMKKPEQLKLPIPEAPLPAPPDNDAAPTQPKSAPEPRTRKYYTATQVSRLLHVEPHVLRYWETKFQIKPERNSAGRRIYNEEQIEKLRRIKFLRYQEKLTIQGARRKIDRLSHVAGGSPVPDDAKATLLWIKQELIAIRDMLTEDA